MIITIEYTWYLQLSMNYMGCLELQRASIFGLRVPDDGTVTFYREIKLKMGFGVVHCCHYDKYTCNS